MEARKASIAIPSAGFVVENVQCINSGVASTGILRLTDYHLVFAAPAPAPKDQSQPTSPPKTRESWITYPILSQCFLRLMPSATGIPSSLRIRCRDFIFVIFTFQDDVVAREVFDFIKTRTCRLGSVEQLFAFHHKPSKVEQKVNGWLLYDPKAEFRRQGISEKSQDLGWRITNINKDYTFCDTYPAVLVVPSSISDNVLKYAKDYRSRNRIPVLSYIHKRNSCTITRSAQPLSGITRKNNVQDEKLVMASFAARVPRTSIEAEQPSRLSQSEASEGASLSELEKYEESVIEEAAPKIYDEKTGKRLIYGAQQANMIVDARPTVNAMVNQVQGMGSEPMDRYPGATKAFMNIENIHVMRNSLNKVVDCIKDADVSSLPPDQNALFATGWLKHTTAVLNGAEIIARQIWFKHSHVLIHCSDGWDRTSQLSALAQILLDPYFRTIEGFMVLVEKDWLSFGHMFRLRSGHLNHESWFTVQRDGMAGQTIQPGENDGRADAFQNVIAGARRFFNQNKDDSAEVDAVAEAATGKVANDEATVPKMISPVFHQFLDCCYQLLRQNPTKFEFNERFLRRLLYHLYSCQYGTFLYNSEKQRSEARVSERTQSVWDYFLPRRAEFTNKDYDPTVDEYVKGRDSIIKPDLKDIIWWHQVFNRSDEEMNSELHATAAQAQNRASALANFQPATEESYARSQPGTPPNATPGNSKPPSLAASQSVLAGVESAHNTMTMTPEEERQGRRQQQGQERHMHRSVSAENSNALSNMRDGFANLNIGRNVTGMLNNLSAPGGRNGSPASTSRVPTGRGEQELREMT
ncbi:hypothetical protein CkaCkLH20_10870 [Colletotrichum karsti]|uniref:Myotubularin phosphatase domain-containing protein n=1 Tax=Colletotrichum karsti TaxID=1095194 RepID=A0A9P6HX72_9PEZI|nr:uncharacterized protein CkaCkLH20_10870 [Colletotrichum karsti]KAF9871672.1 hypothetical protein CkaCkLH20_10870 [Colletotrichum karsti]